MLCYWLQVEVRKQEPKKQEPKYYHPAEIHHGLLRYLVVATPPGYLQLLRHFQITLLNYCNWFCFMFCMYRNYLHLYSCLHHYQYSELLQRNHHSRRLKMRIKRCFSGRSLPVLSSLSDSPEVSSPLITPPVKYSVISSCANALSSQSGELPNSSLVSKLRAETILLEAIGAFSSRWNGQMRPFVRLRFLSWRYSLLKETYPAISQLNKIRWCSNSHRRKVRHVSLYFYNKTHSCENVKILFCANLDNCVCASKTPNRKSGHIYWLWIHLYILLIVHSAYSVVYRLDKEAIICFAQNLQWYISSFLGFLAMTSVIFMVQLCNSMWCCMHDFKGGHGSQFGCIHSHVHIEYYLYMGLWMEYCDGQHLYNNCLHAN